ncbi:hypothetical protein A2U01_0059152, partial [Trifolium medium]|nr:hypothetical protein [Trifolium medium]
MQCSTTEIDGFSILKDIVKKNGKWNVGGLYRG